MILCQLVHSSSTNQIIEIKIKTDRHDVTEILLKVALNNITITQSKKQRKHTLTNQTTSLNVNIH